MSNKLAGTIVLLIISVVLVTDSIAQSLPAPAVAPGSNTPAPSGATLQQRNPRYKLHIGDVLEINFPVTPEFNQVVKVEPDGYVPLTGTSPIHIGDQTVPEVIDKIRKAYAGILHDPEISVALKEFEKPYFVVSGEVRRAGKYDLLTPTTATQALAIAGGITEAAKHSQVLLFHPTPNGLTEVKKINVKRMLKAQDLAEDIRLAPGDMLFVPKNRLSKIERFIPNTSTGVQMNPVH